MMLIKPLYLLSFLMCLCTSTLAHILTDIFGLLPFIGLRFPVPFVLEMLVFGSSEFLLFPFAQLVALLWKLCPRSNLYDRLEAVRSRGCNVLVVNVVLGLCARFVPILE